MSGPHEFLFARDPLTGVGFTEVELRRTVERLELEDGVPFRALLDAWERQRVALRKAGERETAAMATIARQRIQLTLGGNTVERIRVGVERELRDVQEQLEQEEPQLTMGGF